MAKIRADTLLVEKELAENRSRAKALILSGNVFIGQERVNKAGEMIAEDSRIYIKQKEHPFVSRGGMKLQKALKHFAIDVAGVKAIDIGASTGGFTDCLLQMGAKKVTAIDVGKGQLDWKLRNNEQVEVMEKFNARNLTPDKVGGDFEIAVIDVSFISLEKILGPVESVCADGAYIVALVKPQFEAGKAEVSKVAGIIKDPKIHQRVVEKIEQFGISLGLDCLGTLESPILGAKGNKEFLTTFKKLSLN